MLQSLNFRNEKHIKITFMKRLRAGYMREILATDQLINVYLPVSYLKTNLLTYTSDYRLDNRGSILGREKLFFLQPLCPDQLWGPPRPLTPPTAVVKKE
jgi:hypothetical protein